MPTTPQTNRTLTVEFIFDTEEHCVDAFSELSNVSPYNIAYSLQINRGIEKVLISNSDVYLDRLTSREYDGVNQSSWDRQQVLREEWGPDFSENCFLIDANNNICKPAYIGRMNKTPFSYAPTTDLAFEIVAIREGKWLPKVGDNVYSIWRQTFSFRFECVWTKDHVLSPAPDELKYNLYFPSKEQCDAFIAKHSQKPVEPQTQPSPYSDKAPSKIDGQIQIVTQRRGEEPGIGLVYSPISLGDLIKAIDEYRYQSQLDEVRRIGEKES